MSAARARRAGRAVQTPSAPASDRADRSAALRARLARARFAAVTFWRSTARPALRRVTRPLGIASGLGWALAAAGVGAAVLAVSLGWAEMLAIALVAAVVLVAAVPFVLGRAVYSVTVELASTRVEVGQRAVGRLAVRNIATRTAPSTRVLLPVGTAQPEFRMPRLAPDAEHDELFVIPTHRRAVLTLGPVTSVRSDPLDLLRRTVTWTKPTELFVHPRVTPLDAEMTGILRDLEGLPTRELADDDVAFHALRGYVPGDDLRHVHWKSTARTGSVMIRQFEQTRRSHLVVVLSTRRGEYASDDEFELAVSIAGSVGLSAVRAGKTVSLVTPVGAAPVSTAQQFLDALSAVEADAAATGIAALGRAAATAVPGASVVVFVTGSAAAIADIRGGSLRVPVTARSICVRSAEAEQLSRRVVGDLVMASVPELDSLRAAMRAVNA